MSQPDSLRLLCPSAQPDMEGSRVIGVYTRLDENPRVGYLERTLEVTAELLSLAGEVRPTEVFRFSAHCEEARCSHFDGQSCKLATRIVQILPAVVDALPPCQIRGDCRWYRQEGRQACFRCPQVVTQNESPTGLMRAAATPESMLQAR